MLGELAAEVVSDALKEKVTEPNELFDLVMGVGQTQSIFQTMYPSVHASLPPGTRKEVATAAYDGIMGLDGGYFAVNGKGQFTELHYRHFNSNPVEGEDEKYRSRITTGSTFDHNSGLQLVAEMFKAELQLHLKKLDEGVFRGEVANYNYDLELIRLGARTVDARNFDTHYDILLELQD